MRIFYSMVPYTAGNFLDLVESGFYNGLTFHRVENWVVQGGDPNGDGSGNATDPNTGQPHFIRLETNPSLNHNQPGMVAMARSNSPNSASCQFYITKGAAPWCNGKYAVFGRVVGSMDAVYAMRVGDRIISATIVQPQNSNPPPQSDNSSQSSEPADNGKPVKPRDSGF
jgi:cyclophilin family peptidyl-prolyl cis-trans isomerase